MNNAVAERWPMIARSGAQRRLVALLEPLSGLRIEPVEPLPIEA